jgi:hypothetical protein
VPQRQVEPLHFCLQNGRGIRTEPATEQPAYDLLRISEIDLGYLSPELKSIFALTCAAIGCGMIPLTGTFHQQIYRHI